MEDAAALGRTEGVLERQGPQPAAGQGGMRGGSQQGKVSPSEAAGLGAPREAEGGSSRPVPGCVSQEPWWSSPRLPAAWPW